MKLRVKPRYMIKRPLRNGLPGYEALADNVSWLIKLMPRVRRLHDRLMLRRACLQGARWQEDHPGTGVAVNVSPQELRSRRYAVYVRQGLEETGLLPWLLTLEFLESERLDLNDPIVRRNLRMLRQLGVKLALDDVGTGYVATPEAVEWLLSNAPDYCITQIKFDMTLVQTLDDPARYQLAQTFMELARRFGLTVVAEGVETNDQLTAVQNLGCDYAQGYHPSLGPKVDATTATQWLDSHYAATSELVMA